MKTFRVLKDGKLTAKVFRQLRRKTGELVPLEVIIKRFNDWAIVQGYPYPLAVSPGTTVIASRKGKAATVELIEIVTPACPSCDCKDIKLNGFSESGIRRYACKGCGRQFTGNEPGRPAKITVS